MTPLKQLFRQPVRLFAIFLLVGMASAFICLSAGVFASAKATLAQIEERYVTIGVPTTETADVATEYNGLTLHHEESVISQDMWAYMDQLAADGTVIKGAYQQKYISAYCPSIQSVTSGKEDGTYVPSLLLFFNGRHKNFRNCFSVIYGADFCRYDHILWYACHAAVRAIRTGFLLVSSVSSI